MQQRVISSSDGHRVEGCGPDGELVNGFLSHLVVRRLPASRPRLACSFLRFLTERGAACGTWWLPICSLPGLAAAATPGGRGKVVRLLRIGCCAAR